MAQHIQTFTCEDGVNALPDLLVHTDNRLAALSYTNPLHCNMPNRFQIKYMNEWFTDSMRLKWSECEKAGFGASKKADWLTNIHTYKHTYIHTYQALEPSLQSFQYTSLHCVAASRNPEHPLYWSPSQAAWRTPPVDKGSNTRTHTILHACTSSSLAWQPLVGPGLLNTLPSGGTFN